IIWDLSNGTVRNEITSYKSSISSLYVNEKIKIIVTGSVDGKIDVWSLTESAFIFSSNVNDYIRSVVITDDLKIITLLKKKNIVLVLNMHDGTIEQTLGPFKQNAMDIDSYGSNVII